ncbi:MAG: hypothetical protein KIS92_09905 [Planctomycetota bacterium]|nr:hypothetical protein [Planctomycetota bacterium]
MTMIPSKPFTRGQHRLNIAMRVVFCVILLFVTVGCSHCTAGKSDTTVEILRSELGGIRSESDRKRLKHYLKANLKSAVVNLEMLIHSSKSEDVLLAALGYSMLGKDAVSPLRKLFLDTNSTACHGALIATYWFGKDAKYLTDELFILLEYENLDRLPNVVDALYLEGIVPIVCKTIARFPADTRRKLITCFGSESPWTRSRACYVVEKMGKRGGEFIPYVLGLRDDDNLVVRDTVTSVLSYFHSIGMYSAPPKDPPPSQR